MRSGQDQEVYSGVTDKNDFNPALYVEQYYDEVTGQETFYLPLFAQLQWMNCEHPGWRVTSDGFSVMEIKASGGMSDGDGGAEARNIVVGHLAIIDEHGRRVMSFPVDGPILGETSGEIGEIYKDCLSGVLELLGYSPKYISHEHWRKAMGGDVPHPAEAEMNNIRMENLQRKQYFEDSGDSSNNPNSSDGDFYKQCVSLAREIYKTGKYQSLFSGAQIQSGENALEVLYDAFRKKGLIPASLGDGANSPKFLTAKEYPVLIGVLQKMLQGGKGA